MLIHIWQGENPTSRIHECVAGLRDLAHRATPCARAHWCLHRTRGDVTDLQWLSFSDRLTGIEAASAGKPRAGEQPHAPATQCTNGMAIRLQQYAMHAHRMREPSFLPQGDMMARVWSGAIAAEKATAYLGYLSSLGFQDYEGFPGHHATLLLQRREAQRVHVLLMSFWDSRHAVAAYAGADTDCAHYYPFGFVCLDDPPPCVEHFEVLEAAGPLPSDVISS